jgi:hypothetical protein
MSMPAVRSAFVAAAAGALRLKDASLAYAGAAQVLKLTGWHDDGLPFAFVSAPFTGDPVERARAIARDLVAAHTGNTMPAPAPITSLAQTLRGELTNATARAAQIGAEAKAQVANLHAVLDSAEGAVNEVKAAAAEIQSALGLSTNGGPPLEQDAMQALEK